MLIKDAKIVSGDTIFEGDLRVEEGLISKMDKHISSLDGEKVVEAKGRYLLPKLIDTNVRLLDDALSKKNLDRIYDRAKSGGVGSFVLIDDFLPKVENATHLELLNTKALQRDDVKIILSVNSVDKDNRLNNIATFLKNGAKVIYTRSDINGNMLVRVMQYAKMKKVPIFCFCENEDIKNRGVINEGEASFELGLPGISKIAQISEVSKIVELATYFGVNVLFQGLYTAKSLQILKAVKKDNKNVYAEVPVHNLILSDKECRGYNTYAKLISPLQEESEEKKLIKLLREGVIDVITSMHSPKSYIYKDVAFEDAKDGVDALALTLKLGYTYLVRSGVVTFEYLIKLLSSNPAKILGIKNSGEIKEGYRADMILFDPNYKEIVLDDSSLYNQKELFGKIEEIQKG